MAGQEPYGNWLRPPPRRLGTQPGICSAGSQMSPVGSFRPDSPDSFTDEDDYDDVSLSEPNHSHRKLPAEEDPQSQRSKGGTGVYILAGKPVSSSPTREGISETGAHEGRGCREKPVMTLYVLLVLSFVMWVALFFLAVVKYLELSRELKMLSFNYSQSMLQELAETQQGQDHMRIRMATYHQELQDITALVCKALKETQRCSPGWKIFGESCYSFSTETKSWEEAKQICENQNSHLVVVNTDQEQKFLKDTINRSSSYWLGLSHQLDEGTWRWVDGRRLSISYWKPWKEERAPRQQDCGSFGPSGIWSEERCSIPRRWICERPRNC